MEIKLKNEVPVLLLTGYLGSGKTTLLNRILTNERGIKFAVIVNDIGEVNIDADLIEKGGVVGQKDDSLVALQNGCICCTLKMDLVQQLSDILRMHRFDYIVIEASGICEPGPIAQTICSMDKLLPPYAGVGKVRLDCIVTVVDAMRMKDEFGGGLDLLNTQIDEEDIENLVIQQIEFCNIVLLNKANEVSESELMRLYDIVKALQPKAEIIPCNYGDVELDKILNTCMFDFDKVATSATWISEVESEHHDDDDDEEEEHEHEHQHHHDDDEDEHEHEHHHGHHHHHHDGEGEAEEYGIGTYVYYRRQAFDSSRFDEFVARFWPKSVIRAKGLCYFKEEPDICYVFEQAGKQVSLRNAGQWYATMPKEELLQMMDREPGLRRDWDERYGDRMQKLVFIGQHLDKEAIAEALDKCLVD
ncbi:MAG: GTP-binding protein [Bacteroidaceae bacterium]|nr:GTP-binding protein [Bacteroidaceae bacterium]